MLSVRSEELRVRGRVLALAAVTVVAVGGLVGVVTTRNASDPGAGPPSAATPSVTPSSGPPTVPVPVSPSATIAPLPNYVSTNGGPEAVTPPSRG